MSWGGRATEQTLAAPQDAGTAQGQLSNIGFHSAFNFCHFLPVAFRPLGIQPMVAFFSKIDQNFSGSRTKFLAEKNTPKTPKNAHIA